MNSSMRRVLGVSIVAILLIPGTRSLSAWGAVGHHVVARIAWTLLTPGAKAEAQRLLGDGMETFVSASTWADDVRSSRPETSNWHFVDIPVDRPRYDAALDCGPTEHGDCVVAELARAKAVVADRARSDGDRSEALKFLMHFVGDIHQPLHAIDNHDRGGNSVRVLSLRDGPSGRATNLHAVWDTGIINLSTETEAARATRLVAALKSHPVDGTFDPAKWAEESHAIALRDAYRYPGFSPDGPPKDPVALDEAYLARAAPVIDDQLMRGGARLGAVLNAILGR